MISVISAELGPLRSGKLPVAVSIRLNNRSAFVFSSSVMIAPQVARDRRSIASFRNVSISGAHGVVGSADADANAVKLPVRAVRGRVANQVLAVQLLRNLGQRGAEIAGAAHDLCAPAALIRDF